jgi:hypothetical protein
MRSSLSRRSHVSLIGQRTTSNTGNCCGERSLSNVSAERWALVHPPEQLKNTKPHMVALEGCGLGDRATAVVALAASVAAREDAVAPRGEGRLPRSALEALSISRFRIRGPFPAIILVCCPSW